MRINRLTDVVMAAAVLGGALCVVADSGATVPFPADYRKWAVTKSFVASQESKVAGFHHYYANDKAMEGFTSGKFPDGSVIVDERLEAEQHAGGTFEGKRLSIAVMRKDSQRYAETSGWGFDSALGDGQTLCASVETRAACYACHSKQKDRDLVFSTFRK